MTRPTWEPKLESGDAIKKRAAVLVRMTITWTPISLWLATGRIGLVEIAAVIWLTVGYGWLAAASVREEPIELHAAIPLSTAILAPVMLASRAGFEAGLGLAALLGPFMGLCVVIIGGVFADASRTPTHQSIARVATACGAWLSAANGLVALALLLDALMRGGWGGAMLSSALLVPGLALLVTGVFLRTRAARFLARARAGAIPGWAVVPRRSVPRPTEALLDWDADGRGDMVLVRLGADRGYRDSEHAVPVAYL